MERQVKGRMNKVGMFAALLLALSPLFGIQSQWKGTISEEGTVTVIKNPKEPIYKNPILSLKEDFAIGGEDAQGEYAIAHPYALAVDGEGSIYVYELLEARIKAFDRAGRFLRSIGRKGQGPGDIGFALNIYIVRAANELAVPDIGNRRFSSFSLKGKFLNSVPIHESGFASGAVDSKGGIYLEDSPLDPYGGRSAWKKLSPDGTRVLAEIFNVPQDHYDRNPFAPRDCWIIDAQDRLIYGDAKTYEIRCFSPDGKLAQKTVREYEPLKVTTQDMDEFENRKTPPGIVMSRKTINYPTHHAGYRSFFADDLGHLLVQTWERTADNLKDIHDIFDADGRFIGRVALNRHADLINPKPRLIRAGKYYAIEPDKDGYEVVKRYSVEWLKK
jgi:hypothetical protein